MMETREETLQAYSQRIVVGVGEVAVSNNPESTLSTYALGSCVGVIAYDPEAMVGGILHFMLPHSKVAPEKGASQPAMFANTGLPLLFRSLRGLHAEIGRVRLFIAGGASILKANDSFKIGARNIAATDEFLAPEGLTFDRRAIGGTINRTLHLEIRTGEVTLKSPAETAVFSLRD